MKKESKFIVYMHKFPNEKMYIGITSKKPNERWRNGTGYDKEGQPVIYNAIQKYGWENVEHIILFENLTEREAKDKEKELIKKYHTFIRDEKCNGYNMTLGGEGTLGHKLSEESLKRMSLIRLGKTGDECCNSQSVICDGIRYESITEFCEKNNLSRGRVENWLKGKNAMPKEWLDKDLRKEFEEDKRIPTPQEKPPKDRIEYDGKIYNSQKELADFLNVLPSCLCSWLQGKSSMPKEIYDKGIRFLDRENYELKVNLKHFKTIIKYKGEIYNSQKEFADKMGINKATLNSWIKGKNRIPKSYIDNGFELLNGDNSKLRVSKK